MRTPFDMRGRRLGLPARRLLAMASIGLALAGLASVGCAGSNRIGPPISARQQEASARFDSAQLRTLGYSRGWRAYPVVTRGKRVEQVAVFDDIILVLEGGSTLSAIDAVDGSIRWSSQLDTPITPFLGIEREGNLVYANSTSELYVLDALTGELRARQSLPLVVTTGAVRVNGQLLFGCADGQIFGYMPTRQVKLWGNQLNHPVGHRAVDVGGIAAFVSTGGDVMFIDPSRGARVMRAGNGAQFNALFDGPGAPPMAAPGILLVPSNDQSLWAFTPASSRHLWRVPTDGPVTGRPGVHGDTAFITLPNLGFSAVDIGTGEIEWSLAGVDGELVCVRDGLLIVFDARRQTITQIDPATGDVFATVPVPGVRQVRAAGMVDAPIYLITDVGLFARFNPDA